MTYKRPESVLVIVRSLDNQVLLIHRAGSDGFWQSVTGSLEPGELPAACAVREVREETGLVAPVRDCHVMARFSIRASALHRYAPGTRYNDEHLFDCVVPEAAIERVWSETNRDGLRQVCAVAPGELNRI